MRSLAAVGMVTFAVLLGAVTKASAQDVTLEVWSHEADEPAKVAFRELAARNLEKSHPGVKVKITWYEKNPLFAALKTALPAGKGPDVFYLEPDQVEYISAGYIVPLDDLVNWNNIEPWARKVWTHNGKTYGIPQEAYTVELYYNKDALKKLGVDLPAGIDPHLPEPKIFQAMNAIVGSASFVAFDREGRMAWYLPDPQTVDLGVAETVLRRLLAETPRG